MLNRFVIIALIGLLMLIFCGGCTEKSPYPPEVTEVLKKADDNRAELEKVLALYFAGDDTLKLQAAYYLIANMEGHCYATYTLEDSTGEQIDFNVLDYTDYGALRLAFDSLENHYGELDFEKGERIYDMNVITADLAVTRHLKAGGKLSVINILISKAKWPTPPIQ